MWICKKCGEPLYFYIKAGEVELDGDGDIVTNSIVIGDYEICCDGCGKAYYDEVGNIGYWEDGKERLIEKMKALLSGNNTVYFYFNKSNISDTTVTVWTENYTTGRIFLGYCDSSELPDGCIYRGLD